MRFMAAPSAEKIPLPGNTAAPRRERIAVSDPRPADTN
jgi:hypothetical protein